MSVMSVPAGATPKRAIKTRRMKFNYAPGRVDRHYANDGDLIMSHVVAILSAMFPEGEDFFVRSVRYYADRITDPELQEAVKGFTGQETMHGREHRALNERLQELGYPTRRVDRLCKADLARVERRAPHMVQLAITAALEHYTASLAERLLADERCREMLGDGEVRNVLLWHAVEESEHKAVAFDVYRAMGGTEKMRIRVMRMMTWSFIFGTTLHTILSMLADRATYNPRTLFRSIKKLRTSPFLGKEMVACIKDYNRVGFHPNDHDNTELLDYWTKELFGTNGQLAANVK
ncbi:MAG TPA: metal-dependent hydrolase [Mycobacteriales bacterium]|nr:metal-dependent hydrolase [Mycobacteriales bacterium]